MQRRYKKLLVVKYQKNKNLTVLKLSMKYSARNMV